VYCLLGGKLDIVQHGLAATFKFHLLQVCEIEILYKVNGEHKLWLRSLLGISICKVQPIHNDFRAGFYRVIYSSSAYSTQIGSFGAINVVQITPEESRGIKYMFK
jgi:hypothetical protein